MSRHKFAAGLIVAWISTAPLTVRAQGIDLAETLYSAGVQAYFDGNSAQADAYLSRSIAVDPHDPRAYYFRALSRLREGRQDEARADMQTGANLEARAPIDSTSANRSSAFRARRVSHWNDTARLPV